MKKTKKKYYTQAEVMIAMREAEDSTHELPAVITVPLMLWFLGMVIWVLFHLPKHA